MRAKAQVDAQHMAVTGARRQDFDHPPRDPYRRFVGIVARAPRQRFGVEDQDRVDIRRIVELEAAELAERAHRTAAWLPIGHPFGASAAQRRVARRIGSTRGRASDREKSGLYVDHQETHDTMKKKKT